MISALGAKFPDIPDPILWKTELLFRGVRFTDELAQASAEGAAPNFWPYRKRDASGAVQVIPVPYLFSLSGGSVARVRVDDSSSLEVRRESPGKPFALCLDSQTLCNVEFVAAHAWQSYRTKEGVKAFSAGVEQLGDMLVVNLAPGCEYFRVKDDAGVSMRCGFCAYGRFDQRAVTLGQEQGEVKLDPASLARLEEVLHVAVSSGEARHVYITGGSVLGSDDEVKRYVPVIQAVRRAAGDRLRVTCGSGAVTRDGSMRYRDAGADSCCYNLETWDAEAFRAVCPGKAHYVGRDPWVQGLVDAVEVFGPGNVASAFVAGIEMKPPAPGMSSEELLSSVREGATFLLDRGITPLYSPLWPVDGTVYGPGDGISPELFLELELLVFQLRAERRFPVPAWLICPGCSYMLLEVDFDREMGLVPA